MEAVVENKIGFMYNLLPIEISEIGKQFVLISFLTEKDSDKLAIKLEIARVNSEASPKVTFESFDKYAFRVGIDIDELTLSYTYDKEILADLLNSKGSIENIVNSKIMKQLLNYILDSMSCLFCIQLTSLKYFESRLFAFNYLNSRVN